MLQLEAVPALQDNYIWTVHDGRSAMLVDPGEATPILAWLAERRMRLVAVLVTHRHADHCAGVGALRAPHPDLPVFGHASLAERGINRAVAEGARCHVPELGLTLDVLETPGHTLDHLTYTGNGWAFCGDTLFSCGCGRVFDGTPAMLHASLRRLAELPPATLMCCTHEYTLDNLRFALTVDPRNRALLAWQEQASALRARGLPTLPVALADELARNPFLRCHDPGIGQHVGEQTGCPTPGNAEQVFTALRALKDDFR